MEAERSAGYERVIADPQGWVDARLASLDIDRIAAWDPEVAKYIVWLERKLAEARGTQIDGSRR